MKYRLDLVAAKMLVRDGAMWRLAWTAPTSPEGHDGARVVFEVPSAPTEPRLASPEQAATTLATLRREPDKDELELVRAHIPRGEAVVWSARVDPKAFPRVVSPELRPPVASVTAAAPVPNHVPAVLVACVLAILAGALAFALGAKQRFVARACASASVRPRPLIPLRLGPRAVRVRRRGRRSARGAPLGHACLRRGARRRRDGARRASLAGAHRPAARTGAVAANLRRRRARRASARRRAR